MNEQVAQLVAEWDDVYKKGQLSLWVLLAVYERRRYAAEIVEFMQSMSGEAFQVKEQSLYRALRRFKSMGLVDITEEDSPNSGPRRKYYSLTPVGVAVLREFIVRNIKPLFNNHVTALLRAVEKEGNYDKN